MNSRARICFLLSALLLASATLSFGSRDPELETCKHQCRAQLRADEKQLSSCIERCEDYDRKKHGGVDLDNDRSPIQRLRECNRGCENKPRPEECQRKCEERYEREVERYEERGRQERGEREGSSEERGRQERGEREGSSEERGRQERGEREGSSEERGRQERGERDGSSQERGRYGGDERRERGEREGSSQERGRYGGDERRERGEREGSSQERGRYGGDERRERGEREGSSSNNPYVFEDRHFFTGMQTQHGRLRILQKFTERSELLRGIENFRVAILEAQPQTFVVPNHLDADTLVVVAKGRGSVSMVREERRESFSIKEGDIFRVRAGTTAYLVNRDNSERLVLVKLLQPVNTPGNFEMFSGAGGENPESYYKAFSNEILEAAFNVKGDRIKRLFGQQRQGAIIKASAEQIRSMSQHQEGGIWPFGGGESKGTHNLYDKRPVYDNEFGQYYEVDSTQFRQLRDLDVAISLSNITQGAMTAPFYNSKATKIAIVVEGEGYFEMACPHLSQSQSRRQTGYEERYRPSRQTESQSGYETVRSRLRTGTVVVVPAGHPFVAVASNNRNLQILSFKVNAYNNEQVTLAGKRNVVNQLEREAKELAFGVPAREVEEIFRSQQEEFFFEGPGRRADA